MRRFSGNGTGVLAHTVARSLFSGTKAKKYATEVTMESRNVISNTLLGARLAKSARPTTLTGAGARAGTHTRTLTKSLLGGGLALLLVVTASGNAAAQTWTELSPTGGPPGVRHQATAVLDGATNRMTIFGGQVGPGVCSTNLPTNDVWVLENADGTGGTPTWTERFPTGGPPAARVEHSALYATNTRMIVFGGANPGVGVFGDLWVLTNANGIGGISEWILLAPSADPVPGFPAARRVHAAAYDSATNRMILAQGVGLNDLWVLTHANGLGGTPQWTKLFATGALPPSGSIHNVGYDPATNRMMILSDSSGQLRVLEHANGLGGTPNWVAPSPSGDVPGDPPFSILFGFGSGGAYDPSADRYFMFGGFDGGARINDTFILENATSLTLTPTWTHLGLTGVLPSNRESSSVVLNADGDRMITFAGRDFVGCPGVVHNDTWVLDFVPSNTPPEITVNNPTYTLEGNTVGGYNNTGLVAVAAGVSATDAEDDAVALTNDAPGFLPLGDTTVTWTATDSQGLTDEGDQTVTVVDTTAPNITVPLFDITEEATSPAGNVILFATSTSDIVDASPTVTCVPASGSVFVLGTTTVNCIAEDASGNESPSSFDVTLTLGDETFDGFATTIQEIGLQQGSENAMVAKVEAAKKSLGKGNVNAALGSLNALLNQISAQAGKKLTPSQAAELTAAVTAIMTAI